MLKKVNKFVVFATVFALMLTNTILTMKAEETTDSKEEVIQVPLTSVDTNTKTEDKKDDISEEKTNQQVEVEEKDSDADILDDSAESENITNLIEEDDIQVEIPTKAGDDKKVEVIDVVEKEVNDKVKVEDNEAKTEVDSSVSQTTDEIALQEDPEDQVVDSGITILSEEEPVTPEQNAIDYNSIKNVDELVQVLTEITAETTLTLSEDFVSGDAVLVIPKVPTTINAKGINWNNGVIDIVWQDGSSVLKIDNLKMLNNDTGSRGSKSKALISVSDEGRPESEENVTKEDNLPELVVFNSLVIDGGASKGAINSNTKDGIKVTLNNSRLSNIKTNQLSPIYLHEGSSIDINDSTFESNEGMGVVEGSGVIYSKNNKGEINISNSFFKSNSNKIINSGTIGGGEEQYRFTTSMVI
ncbi:hypothetical protein G7059_02945 [Erysipelothrix sp. HDW6A]|uniref:hypothetical protein n=1 Tax=Erysipelothrix sp. HDW6A TaxID=2714928 RepID=UPI00140A18B2|nr:hypothetical protein [Erysipelothrix sp. HDW6A]QIK56878.1 hypothetical protein G7059_02945 [Erysipelothrix sp. HDW6A]